MTPPGAAEGRRSAFSGPDAPHPSSLCDDAATRRETARALLRRSEAPATTRNRIRLGAACAAHETQDEERGRGRDALDRALGGGLLREALHEIAPKAAGDRVAAFGFTLAVAARLAQGRPILWVGDEATLAENGAPYAPGLERHGIAPRRLVMVRAVSARDAFWALEEATKSGAVGAAVGEIGRVGSAYDLTASRRLALAARAGATPCLLLLSGLPGQADALSSAAATRFEIAAAPSRGAAAGEGAAPSDPLSPDPPSSDPPLSGLSLPGPPCWEGRLAKRRGGAQAGFEEIGRRFRLMWRIETGALEDDDEAAFVEPRSAVSGG